MVPQQVSFVERSSLSQRVPYQRFHCIYSNEVFSKDHIPKLKQTPGEREDIVVEVVLVSCEIW